MTWSAPRRNAGDKENQMSSQTITMPVVEVEKVPEMMTLRFHIYPDARSTTMKRYCSAWSRRYGRSLR
jgi:hypothetical protein